MALFKDGDVVVLKSGGPPMTVSSVKEEGRNTIYFCVWFKGASKEYAQFVEHTLQLYTPPK